jgi:hypothetical protein
MLILAEKPIFYLPFFSSIVYSIVGCVITYNRSPFLLSSSEFPRRKDTHRYVLHGIRVSFCLSKSLLFCQVHLPSTMERYGPSGRYRNDRRRDNAHPPQRNRMPGQRHQQGFFNDESRRRIDDRHYEFIERSHDEYDREYFERRGHPSDYRSSRRTLPFDDDFDRSQSSGGDRSQWPYSTHHRSSYDYSSPERSRCL